VKGAPGLLIRQAEAMARFSARRRWLRGLVGGAGALALAGCDRLSQDDRVQATLRSAEKLTKGSQRLLLDHQPLAREYGERDLSPRFRANGSTMPESPEYKRLLQGRFADYRLQVDGLVQRPLGLSLAELKAMKTRQQITRHDCVEGWSAIGKWQGVPLGQVLDLAGLKPGARYVIFHCADNLAGNADASGLYYESIDLLDAYHPQTILAYGMNGGDLPVAHGAPLRLRVERQLGYKQAKFVMRIEVADGFSRLHGGRGGFWEDRGYEWYAGI
jgi:DMSO/TMAO reductase YedYZ molybdopterin-dependent catalytic subunit